MTPKSFKTTLIIIAAVLSPLTVLTVTVATIPFNFMALGFLTSFTVANDTSVDIWVTPIGAIDKAGLRRTLPYSRSKKRYLISAEDRDFHVAPRSSRTFVYDWDDVQFSEVLARTSAGPFRVLPTGLHPTEIQFRRPEHDVFRISDLEILAVAAPVHLAAFESNRSHRTRTLYVLAAVGLLPPVLLFLVLRRRHPAPTRKCE